MSNLIRSIEFGMAVARRLKRALLARVNSRLTNWYGLLMIHKFYINDKEEKFFTFHNLHIKIVLHSLFTAVCCLI